MSYNPVNPNGQATSANSAPVVLASDQSAIKTVINPSTTGGVSSIATGTIGNTATSIKSSAGQVYAYYIFNNNVAPSYVQFFNTAVGSVTVGTTAPIASFGIPAGGGANLSFPTGWAFSTAITIAVTTTRSGSTSPSNTVDYNIVYA